MSTILIRAGHVTSLDESIGELPDGDVLIDGDTIKAVGRRLDAPGATVIDAAGKIVVPGLVDAHRHVWQSALTGDAAHGSAFGTVLTELPDRYEPQDVYAGVLWGALRAIDSGITTDTNKTHIITAPGRAGGGGRARRGAGGRARGRDGPPSGGDGGR